MKVSALTRLPMARVARVVSELRNRGLPVPRELVDHEGDEGTSRVRLRLRESVSSLYEKSRAELASAFVVARAIDGRPREIGPYNGIAISTAVLAALETISPRYMSALVESLGDIAVLQTLPVVEKVVKSTKGAQRRPSRRPPA